MMQCWENNPEKRPSFSTIVGEIKLIIDPEYGTVKNLDTHMNGQVTNTASADRVGDSTDPDESPNEKQITTFGNEGYLTPLDVEEQLGIKTTLPVYGNVPNVEPQKPQEPKKQTGKVSSIYDTPDGGSIELIDDIDDQNANDEKNKSERKPKRTFDSTSKPESKPQTSSVLYDTPDGGSIELMDEEEDHIYDNAPGATGEDLYDELDDIPKEQAPPVPPPIPDKRGEYINLEEVKKSNLL